MSSVNGSPLISVVIPAYNAQDFLPPCIESVLGQTYSHFELILIDDGSTDETPRICDEYAKKDARVRALHTENRGVSAARNLGAKEARGALIAFVDADDRLSAGMLDCLYRAMRETGAQVSACGMRQVQSAAAPLPPRTGDVVALTAEQALATMLYQKLFYTAPWAKLARADIVRAHPFPENQRYEDMATVYLWLADADTVAFDPSVQYDYVQHAESFMGQAFSEARFQQLDTCQEVYDFIEKRFPAVLPAARARRFAAYCQILLQTPAGEKYRARREQMRNIMRADARLVVRDRNCRGKDRVAAAVFCIAGERGLRLVWLLKRA